MALASPPALVDDTNRALGRPAAVALGHRLFFDPALSASGEVSCASCHDPAHAFSVNTPLGRGAQATSRHPPSLLNVAHHRWFDWDGKADSLWAQAARPLEHPDEHGLTRSLVARHVASDSRLRGLYESAFEADPLPALERVRAWPREADEPATREEIERVFVHALKAIAAYESKLNRVNSPFDRWVVWNQSGAQGASPMSPEAERGARLFVGKARCITCHNGPMFSDMDFHNLGLGPRDWLAGERADEGRALGVDHVKRDRLNASGPFSDDPDGERAQWTRFLKRTPENRGQFKTPSLRNVALSAPYMHGGHFATLKEVVRFYVTLDEPVQIGHREDALKPAPLSEEEQRELVAFLEALTGTIPEGERALFEAP